jgi:hypothetical protein
MSSVAATPGVDVGALWRSVRFPAILTVIGLGLVAVLALIGRSPNTVPLDPRNADADGTHALAALLAARGVTVSEPSRLADVTGASGDATVVLANPDRLSTGALRAIATSAASVVLLAPSDRALAAFGLPLSLDAVTPRETLSPQCALPAATVAGSVQITGDLYALPRTRAAGAAPGTALTAACYGESGDAALIVGTRPGGAPTIVMGSTATLTNAGLAADGDAALALGLLTESPETGAQSVTSVRWVSGSLGGGPVPSSRIGLEHLLPPRLIAAVVQLFIALVILALWRARRFGKPVVEPLPVVVRAAETVEGHARLMHAARARSSAARALRTATLRRLSHLLRLGTDDDDEALAGLVTQRSGLPAAEVRSVLYGDDPRDDDALVRLAQQLPGLESAVRDGAGRTSGGQR